MSEYSGFRCAQNSAYHSNNHCCQSWQHISRAGDCPKFLTVSENMVHYWNNTVFSLILFNCNFQYKLIFSKSRGTNPEFWKQEESLHQQSFIIHIWKLFKELHRSTKITLRHRQDSVRPCRYLCKYFLIVRYHLRWGHLEFVLFCLLEFVWVRWGIWNTFFKCFLICNTCS